MGGMIKVLIMAGADHLPMHVDMIRTYERIVFTCIGKQSFLFNVIILRISSIKT